MAKYSLQALLQCVDLGVAVYIPTILEQGAILTGNNADDSDKQQAKAKLKETATAYRDAFNELLNALDAPQTTPEAPRVTAYGIEDPETDKAMDELTIALDCKNSFTFFLEAISQYSSTHQELRNQISNLAYIQQVFAVHIESKRSALEKILQKGEK